jgi:hypothetical protein
MITIRAKCTDAEKEAQLQYLWNTPVRGLCCHILDGSLDLYRGQIASTAAMGQLKTEFGAIGPLTPQGDKFLVSELLPRLRANPAVQDDGLRQRIESLLEPMRRGEVSINITVLREGNLYYVKDGNKRAVARYELAVQSGDDSVSLNVHILVPRDVAQQTAAAAPAAEVKR